MREMLQFYIDGKWVDPVTPNTLDVINPATEEPCGRISLGSAAEPRLIRPQGSSVAGLMTSSVFGVAGSTPLPSM